jgi:hypothetical protein
VADLIVLLTEQALGAGDAARIIALHADEQLAYHVLVPADTERNLLVDVVDHLSMLELRQALDAVLGREPSDAQSRTGAADALAATVAALQAAGRPAEGAVTEDDPLPTVRAAVESLGAREVVVVTRPHALEDTFHRDWATCPDLRFCSLSSSG